METLHERQKQSFKIIQICKHPHHYRIPSFREQPFKFSSGQKSRLSRNKMGPKLRKCTTGWLLQNVTLSFNNYGTGEK